MHCQGFQTNTTIHCLLFVRCIQFPEPGGLEILQGLQILYRFKMQFAQVFTDTAIIKML